MPRRNNNRIWDMEKSIFLFKVEQIAYPVGPNKTAYTILTRMYMDTEKMEVTGVECSVYKDYYTSNSDNKPLTKGSYKECYDFIEDIVLSTNLQPWDEGYVVPSSSSERLMNIIESL